MTKKVRDQVPRQVEESLFSTIRSISAFAGMTKNNEMRLIKRSSAFTLLLALLLMSGCAAMPTGPEAGGATADQKVPVVRQLVKGSQSWNGASLPAYPQGQPEITILRISIPAGARLETHSHPVINSGVLLSGELTVVTTDGRTLHLKAGDPIVEVVNTLHYGVNEGDVPADIIVFYTGTVGSPITIVKPQ